MLLVSKILASHNWDVWKRVATGRYLQPLRRWGAMQRETDPRKPGIGKTVLAVDDNAAIRKMFATAFCHGFKTCIEAENGKEAIDVAKQNKPDVIALDLSMPCHEWFAVGTGTSKIIPANSNNSLFLIRAEPVKNRDIQGRDKPSS